MNENDKQVSGVEVTANAEPSKGRRRLVKGAMLATPAVMTLMSGRLASAASSGQCPIPETPQAPTGVEAGQCVETNYVSNGYPLKWCNIDGTLQLGYTDTNTVFTPAQPDATSSCWASLPY